MVKLKTTLSLCVLIISVIWGSELLIINTVSLQSENIQNGFMTQRRPLVVSEEYYL